MLTAPAACPCLTTHLGHHSHQWSTTRHTPESEHTHIWYGTPNFFVICCLETRDVLLARCVCCCDVVLVAEEGVDLDICCCVCICVNDTSSCSSCGCGGNMHPLARGTTCRCSMPETWKIAAVAWSCHCCCDRTAKACKAHAKLITCIKRQLEARRGCRGMSRRPSRAFQQTHLFSTKEAGNRAKRS